MAFEGQGVLAAVTTPLDAANRVDVALLAQHSADLLRRGLHGITLFGTTGEGPSFTVDERSATLEGLLARGIESSELVVGTGAAALGDAISLTRHALAQGCRRVLLLPPFFFKGVSSAGVAEAIGQVIDAVGDSRLRVILYHIPQVSGVGFDDEAIATLRQRYGSVIDGIKDSSGNLDHSLALIRNHPGLNVYVGAEDTIGRARAAGGAGSICGLANIAPEQVRASYDSARDPDSGVITALLRAVDGQSFVPLLKAWVAACQGNDGWRRVRAPLVGIDAHATAALPRALLSGAAA
ncbi:dihydrodipicolinate synthase family protein [Paraburkholderia caffeinilytica]|uniref:Dihydrodipicolinate synthase family protein n=1 Tax=Paraburkholderia caffeinilytica TaxID=1761016 RepID=A0ABQ1NET2_9BURK|nr:dihydrodipicolinate synthase family protein [Paraburkholderia caffeinilytica]AXL48786.1 dihydrodipicolinate synthase family protein [Paraburkholderia caffeinilytica]GGC68820.1 dihydrodipicolinate synthase family protein [Paraburkholderia caffeinilytica]CAB3784182.1 4-hydroxy-tetrahydrodipicolinate synthase [Paraburkholderia caffeinilytica]